MVWHSHIPIAPSQIIQHQAQPPILRLKPLSPGDPREVIALLVGRPTLLAQCLEDEIRHRLKCPLQARWVTYGHPEYLFTHARPIMGVSARAS